jgi:hypothetical protein
MCAVKQLILGESLNAEWIDRLSVLLEARIEKIIQSISISMMTHHVLQII